MREMSPQPEADADLEYKFDQQAQTEALGQKERTERLTAIVEKLFPGEVLADLRKNIDESFRVPQFGDYHNEGMFMDTHLDLILKNIENIGNDQFPAEIPARIRESLKATVLAYGETLVRYTFLHDLAKKDCLTVRYQNGESKEFTWADWQAQLPAGAATDPVALRSFCKTDGVKSVSYFQKGQKKGESKHHGAEAKKQLEAIGSSVGVSAAVLTAIEKHEVAYQFSKVAAKTYKEHLGSLSPEERDLAITASYIDTAASLKKNGNPDLSNFAALVASRDNFELISKVEEVLTANKALDPKKVQKAIADHMNLDHRIDETLDSITIRLSHECRPTEYDLSALDINLTKLVVDGTITDEEKNAIIDAITKQDVSAVGKQFGKRMAKITPAMKQSEKP